MAKIVKTMTKSAWDYAGLKRFPEGDFSDDGTRFRMYIYKDFLKVSYATGDGDKYISIRDDYSNYSNTDYDFFHTNFKEAADCTWDFNGVPEVDLDKLKENLEKVYQALQEAPKLYQQQINTNRKEREQKVLDNIMEGLDFNYAAQKAARAFDVLDADFEKIYAARGKNALVCWCLKDFKSCFDEVKKAIKYYKDQLIKYRDGKLDDQTLMAGEVYAQTYYAEKITNTINIAKSVRFVED